MEPFLYVEETRYTLGARGIESIVAERVEGPTDGGVTADTPVRAGWPG